MIWIWLQLPSVCRAPWAKAIAKSHLWHSSGDAGQNPGYTCSSLSVFMKPAAMRYALGQCVLFRKHSPTLFSRFFRGNSVCGISSFVYCIVALFELRLVLVCTGSVKGYWNVSCFTNWWRQVQGDTLSGSSQLTSSAETAGVCSPID